MTTVFHNWHDFINMGGYGPYIWTAYGAMAVVLLTNVFCCWRRYKKVRKCLRSQC